MTVQYAHWTCETPADAVLLAGEIQQRLQSKESFVVTLPGGGESVSVMLVAQKRDMDRALKEIEGESYRVQ